MAEATLDSELLVGKAALERTHANAVSQRFMADGNAFNRRSCPSLIMLQSVQYPDEGQIEGTKHSLSHLSNQLCMNQRQNY